VDTLVDKVVNRPDEVTDADFAAAEASGLSEDQLFEVVVCAAAGQSERLYAAGLAALDDGEAR
jgi:alkylhydroperoxidase family enzyme